MKSSKHTLALYAALLIAGIGQADAAEKLTVVAFGDSTTAPRRGVNVYAERLAGEFPQLKIINAGVGGDTTAKARQRFETDVLARRPALVVLQFGINDSAVDVWKNPPATEPRVSVPQYEDNLRHFVQALRKQGAEVILMTPNPLRWTDELRQKYGRPPYQSDAEDGFNVALIPFVGAMRRVANEEKVTLIDLHTAYFEEAKRRNEPVDHFLPDGMHPNSAGHALVASLLKEHLARLVK